jgi:predicted ATPase
LKRAQEAVALANELEHALTRGKAMFVAGCMVDQLRGERRAVRARAEDLIRFSTEHRLPVYRAAGTILLGWAQGYEAQTRGARPERVEEGIARMHEGLAELRALGMRMHLTHLLGLLVEAYLCAGRTEEGLSAVAEALALVEETSERYYEPELHRLRGELLLQGEEAEAEASFHKAIDVARGQQAKSWELRATASLCRLWREQGRLEEARQRLGDIYGWFAEGFDTLDLREARVLLQDLS